MIYVSDFPINSRLRGVKVKAVFDDTMSNIDAQVSWIRRMPIHTYTVTFGLRDASGVSLNVPIVAHEALHMSRKIVTGNWRDWAPPWPCRYPREETSAWVVESIVGAVVRAACSHGILLNYAQRPHERRT